jgi:hypothetical protein
MSKPFIASRRDVTPQVQASPDPAFRFDLLLLNLGEALARKADEKLRTGVLFQGLWGGPDGMKQVVQEKIDEIGIPREKLTPKLIAERAGFLGRRRLRRAG